MMKPKEIVRSFIEQKLNGDIEIDWIFDADFIHQWV